MKKTQQIEITTDYLKLEQLLKIADIVSSGGEAKLFLQENEILVNGEEEHRRGRKLYPGDLITIAGKVYEICR
ncbi:MAG: S4 domain-containing protein YaaA [Erysipelotrichaceae bacterium]|nr:S4 domain-containing protein YaaA [Erysipelotrichaceae bacterium]